VIGVLPGTVSLKLPRASHRTVSPALSCSTVRTICTGIHCRAENRYHQCSNGADTSLQKGLWRLKSGGRTSPGILPRRSDRSSIIATVEILAGFAFGLSGVCIASHVRSDCPCIACSAISLGQNMSLETALQFRSVLTYSSWGERLDLLVPEFCCRYFNKTCRSPRAP